MAAPLPAPERSRPDPLAPDPEAKLRRLALALERRGLLDAVLALLERGDQSLGQLLGRADRPATLDRLGGWSLVLRRLADLDPTVVARALGVLRAPSGPGSSVNGTAPGVSTGGFPVSRPLRSVLDRLRRPEVWRGLVVTLDLLAALGGAGTDQHEPPARPR
jgi:uncharacterized protein YjgD (DUF1641 family)